MEIRKIHGSETNYNLLIDTIKDGNQEQVVELCNLLYKKVPSMAIFDQSQMYRLIKFLIEENNANMSKVVLEALNIDFATFEQPSEEQRNVLRDMLQENNKEAQDRLLAKFSRPHIYCIF